MRTRVGCAVLEASRNPSGLKLTQLTVASWTRGPPIGRSVSASQKRAVLSVEALARMLRLGQRSRQVISSGFLNRRRLLNEANSSVRASIAFRVGVSDSAAR